jgi:hypothetical protein
VSRKPLGRKAYGSIPHLPESRVGPGDHHCEQGQARICTEKVRDKFDRVIVQRKEDGSCCAVAKLNGQLLALTRAGYLATTSQYEQHHFFDHWVRENHARFDELLEEGERVVGEWLAQAHGTRYEINCLFEPFVAFDIITGTERLPWDDFVERICSMTRPLNSAMLIGYGPMSTTEAMAKVSKLWTLDPVEGVVYRAERYDRKACRWTVNFLCKYVRPDKVDGSYLPEVSGKPAVWNWRPDSVRLAA